jgi:hypothetical protein
MAVNMNAAANGISDGDPSVANIFNFNGMNGGMDRQAPPTQELGTTGVPIYAGRVYDEWDPRLQGDLAIRVYREMQTYPIVASILFGIDQLIRKVQWSVEPGDGEDVDSDSTHLVETSKDDMSMSWPLTLSQNFSMVPYGWSFSEIVYKRRLGYMPPGKDPNGNPLPSSKHKDGLFGWRKIALRTQETRWRWEIDDEGGVQGMWQSAPPNYVPRYIPIERGLLFRTSLVRPSPEGTSVLRGAYNAWYWAKRFQRIEGIGIERDLVGIPMIGVPPEILQSTATPDQVAARESLKDLATNLRRDEKEGFLFPLQYNQDNHKIYEISLLTTGGSRQFDVGAVIARYNQQIALSVLADFILLGHEGTGSYALSASKIDFFTTALQSYLDVTASVYNDHAIPRLMAINGMDPEKSPKLVPGKVTETDFGSLGTYLQSLAAAGADLFPNETLTRELLRRADLPDDLPEEDEKATDLLGDTPPSQRNGVPTATGEQLSQELLNQKNGGKSGAPAGTKPEDNEAVTG